MLSLVSVSGFSNNAECGRINLSATAVPACRGGLFHGTKVATTGGWTLAERLRSGDLVRTLDHGFQAVRRVCVDQITVPGGETRPGHLPVLVSERVAYNGRPVWLMPEQGVAVNASKIGQDADGVAIVPARMLSGLNGIKSSAPAQSFDVISLFFDNDEVVYIEGGFQAYCAATRIPTLRTEHASAYKVVGSEDADANVEAAVQQANVSAFVSPIGAAAAPIQPEPVVPIRPSVGVRRPGRPGRPTPSALFS